MNGYLRILLPASWLLLSSCGSGFVDIVPLSIDQQLGEQSAAEIEANPAAFDILERAEFPEPYTVVERIKDKILNSGAVEHGRDFEWDLKIVHDDSVLNAFCLPGGRIYVYTGLIKYLNSEDALAGVLGHEMAHADLRHSTGQLVKNAGLGLAIQLIFGVDNSMLVSLGANLLSLSFSRSDEADADLRSVEYLYQTDLDARGVARFFEQLQADHKDPGVIEFISTHPNPEHRVKHILEKWKELGGKEGERFEGEYRKMKSTLP